jgi:hypothetical protein
MDGTQGAGARGEALRGDLAGSHAREERAGVAAQFAAEAIAMASARVEAPRASRSRWRGLRGFRAWLYRHTVVVAIVTAAVWVFAGLVLGYIWAG